MPIKSGYYHILDMRVDVMSSNDASRKVLAWTNVPAGRYVCAANVHMCMEAYDNHDFRGVVNNADLVVPDGKPLVWALNLLGIKHASQVRGSDLLLAACKEAMKYRVPIGLYGGTPDSLRDFQAFLKEKHPALNIILAISPPFRPLTEDEDAVYVEQINASGIRILFVGIGCPKQEKWMAAHKDRLSCVMIGVGAAFDFFSGRKKTFPRWVQRIGMEWFCRLIKDPKRLWKRYFKHNPRFLYYALLQILKQNRMQRRI